MIIVKILWVSNYPMTEEQLEDLKRIYPDAYKVEIVVPDISPFDVSKIIKHLELCDALAINVPIPVLTKLLKSVDTPKNILVPEYNSIYTGKKIKDELTYTMKEEHLIKHLYWKKAKLEICYEVLK